MIAITTITIDDRSMFTAALPVPYRAVVAMRTSPEQTDILG